MALANTTLSVAVAEGDKQIVVASGTSVAAGRFFRVDDEMMQADKSCAAAATTVPVLRGLLGTKVVAHPVTALVEHGLSTDFDGAPAQDVTASTFHRVTRVVSYSAAGAITLPNQGEDLRVILNSTDALAMTIADPGRDIEGAKLTVLANGAAAHTLTFASGLSGASTSYDVLTFNGTAIAGADFYAVGGYWVCPVAVTMGGTLTNITATLA